MAFHDTPVKDYFVKLPKMYRKARSGPFTEKTLQQGVQHFGRKKKNGCRLISTACINRTADKPSKLVVVREIVRETVLMPKPGSPITSVGEFGEKHNRVKGKGEFVQVEKVMTRVVKQPGKSTVCCSVAFPKIKLT